VTKILSQTGISLSDLYDVEGSIVGVEQLLSKDVSLVHEMGATIFSERASGSVSLMTSGAIAQNITWNLNLLMGTDIRRIFRVQVLADVAARVSHASVNINNRNAAGATEIPIFNWQTGVGDDVEKLCRVELDGTIANLIRMESGQPFVPIMTFGTDQPRSTSMITFRGVTTGFGAGTVLVRALIYEGFALPGALSSRGLPLPSW